MLVLTLVEEMSPSTSMARVETTDTPAPAAFWPLALIRASKVFSSVL